MAIDMSGIFYFKFAKKLKNTTIYYIFYYEIYYDDNQKIPTQRLAKTCG